MDTRAQNELDQPQLNIAGHIFANSPTMLALCLTVIGLIKIYANLERISTVADNFLAFGVICFLFATVFSYLALRARTHTRRMLPARLADVSFLAGLSCATAVAVFIAFSLAH
jgi:hypothetical protein